MCFTGITLKNFLSKVENTLLKIGREHKIYQPKAVLFVHYYILFCDVVDVLTVNFLANMGKTLD